MAECRSEMKKEIGSIFPLSDDCLKKAELEQVKYPSDRIYYSLCREALFDIATVLAETNKRVLISAYTCQTVITPFEEAGWECFYYSVHNTLRIDIKDLFDNVNKKLPSLVVVHPYFGMDFNDEETCALESIKDKGIDIVLDLTQCLFSSKPYSFPTFVVASYRKWMPIPDGGYLKNFSEALSIIQPEEENEVFTGKECDAMYLRGQYFGNGYQRTKAVSIRLSKSADHLAESNITPHKMSQIAYSLFLKEDKEYNQKQRYENYRFLYDNIKDNEQISKVCQDLSEVTTAPLYFTIYVCHRASLQKVLAQDAIYAPVIWPVEDERVLINDEVRYIYEHILAIPCDQRYNEDDMQRVVDIINNYK